MQPSVRTAARKIERRGIGMAQAPTKPALRESTSSPLTLPSRPPPAACG